MEAARELADLLDAALGALDRVGDVAGGRAGRRAERPLRELEREHRVHELLLRAVVQVAHDAPARVVARREQADAGRGQLVAAVRVGDRGVEQLGEPLHPLLRLVGRRPRCAHRAASTPHSAAVDDDGHRDRRPDTGAARDVADRARSPAR